MHYAKEGKAVAGGGAAVAVLADAQRAGACRRDCRGEGLRGETREVLPGQGPPKEASEGYSQGGVARAQGEEASARLCARVRTGGEGEGQEALRIEAALSTFRLDSRYAQI